MPSENLDLQKRMRSIGNGENIDKFNFQISTLSMLLLLLSRFSHVRLCATP